MTRANPAIVEPRFPEFSREWAFIADFCNHVNDDGGKASERWSEHLHEPALEGGHRYCGPCRAQRVRAQYLPAQNGRSATRSGDDR